LEQIFGKNLSFTTYSISVAGFGSVKKFTDSDPTCEVFTDPDEVKSFGSKQIRMRNTGLYPLINVMNLRGVENTLGDVRQEAAAAHRHIRGMDLITVFLYLQWGNSMDQTQRESVLWIQNDLFGSRSDFSGHSKSGSFYRYQTPNSKLLITDLGPDPRIENQEFRIRIRILDTNPSVNSTC